MHSAVHRLIRTLLLASALVAALPAAATSFVYRGSLNDRGEPAEGRYAFRLSFYDAQVGGKSLASPITLDGVAVSHGAFSTEFDLDSALRSRESLWLEVAVADANGGFVPLAERQVVQPNAAGVCWDTQGNAAVAGDFLGTTNTQALVLRSNNASIMRLESAAGGSANVIGGSPSNAGPSSGTGVGATVAGGGSIVSPNRVAGNYSSVGGGLANVAGNLGSLDPATSQFAMVGGGHNNVASGISSTIAGGEGNSATSVRATVGGGQGNSVVGDQATVPGGLNNYAGGLNSFAAGEGASVRDAAQAGFAFGDFGTFVWSDSADGTTFASTGANQFLMRARGGVGMNTNTPLATLTISGANDPRFGPNIHLVGAVQDQFEGGRIRMTENAISYGGAFIHYDANLNTLRLGVHSAADVLTTSDIAAITVPRNTGQVGILRTPATNALEVEGNTSKTVAGSWLANSDARIKKQIAPVEHAIDTLLRIRPVTFRYNEDYRAAHPSIADQRYYNVVAQEFAEVFPDAVRSSGELVTGTKAARENEILQVDIHPALITTIAAAQELAVNADAQAERIERLEADNARLRERLDRIERQLTARP